MQLGRGRLGELKGRRVEGSEAIGPHIPKSAGLHYVSTFAQSRVLSWASTIPGSETRIRQVETLEQRRSSLSVKSRRFFKAASLLSLLALPLLQ